MQFAQRTLHVSICTIRGLEYSPRTSAAGGRRSGSSAGPVNPGGCHLRIESRPKHHPTGAYRPRSSSGARPRMCCARCDPRRSISNTRNTRRSLAEFAPTGVDPCAVPARQTLPAIPRAPANIWSERDRARLPSRREGRSQKPSEPRRQTQLEPMPIKPLFIELKLRIE